MESCEIVAFVTHKLYAASLGYAHLGEIPTMQLHMLHIHKSIATVVPYSIGDTSEGC